MNKITDDLKSNHDDGAITLIAKNLAHLMTQKKVDAATLSNVTRMGIATVNSLRRGVGNPTFSTIVKLANFFGVSLSELTEMDLSEKSFRRSTARTIPFIKISDINKFLDKSLKKYETYTTELESSDEKSYFAILVNNDSLCPQFSMGTVFVISKDEEPCDGDIVLVKISNHSPCFRKLFINGDDFLFSSIALEGEIAPSMYEDYELIGVVLKAIKTFSER